LIVRTVKLNITEVIETVRGGYRQRGALWGPIDRLTSSSWRKLVPSLLLKIQESEARSPTRNTRNKGFKGKMALKKEKKLQHGSV